MGLGRLDVGARVQRSGVLSEVGQKFGRWKGKEGRHRGGSIGRGAVSV